MPDQSDLSRAERPSAASDELAQLREENAQLLKAVESRDVIGQAKGILMERKKIPATEAFDALRLESQRSNIKLVEIARQLADTGEWPVGRIGGA